MKNKKLLIVIGIVIVLIGGGVVTSVVLNNKSQKVDVHVVDRVPSRETSVDNEDDTLIEDVVEPEDEEVKEEEKKAEEDAEAEKERQEAEVEKQRQKELAAQVDNHTDVVLEDVGNGIVKSTFVHVGHTDNSDTYLGVTGGGDDVKQYFYDFEQFDEFLNLIGRKIPEHGSINHQGDVFTAYYADGMYMTYNTSTDKMVVTTGVQSDDEEN